MSIPGDFIEEYFGVVHGGHYDRYREMGARWCRTDFPVWQIIDPKALFSFDAWDNEIRSATANGVRMLPILDVNYTPPWANTEGVFAFPPRSIDQVKQAVEAFVSRYGRPPFSLKIFEVSNEPNIGWFWRTRDPNDVQKEYIDKILIPTAEIVHAHGCKVVAPSITMEWPENSWPGGSEGGRTERDRPERPAAKSGPIPRKCWNLDWCIKAVRGWLLYHDAWKHVDFFGLHYTKGDTEKHMLPFAENLMPLYDYLMEEWVKPGKIEGIWNTEEGLTCMEAGNVGDVSLEPWEVAPYGQWVPKYTIPVIHWAIQKGWSQRDQYKCFWYNIRSGGALSPTSMLAPATPGQGTQGQGTQPVRVAECGRAMHATAGLFSGAARVDIFSGVVEVGFGLTPKDPSALNYFAAYLFTTYAFAVDGDILVAAWMDLPGLESEGAAIECVIRSSTERSITVQRVVTIDFLTGDEREVPFRKEEDALRFELPRKPDPIIYVRVKA